MHRAVIFAIAQLSCSAKLLGVFLIKLN